VWLIILSDQLPVLGLVSRYLTNYLMGRRLIVGQHPCEHCFFPKAKAPRNVSGISPPFGRLSQSQRKIAHVLLTRAPLYSQPKLLSRSTCMC
jgi:hypothetical protein